MSCPVCQVRCSESCWGKIDNVPDVSNYLFLGYKLSTYFTSNEEGLKALCKQVTKQNIKYYSPYYEIFAYLLYDTLYIYKSKTKMDISQICRIYFQNCLTGQQNKPHTKKMWHKNNGHKSTHCITQIWSMFRHEGDKASHNGSVKKYLYLLSRYIVNKWMAISCTVHRTCLLSIQLTIRTAASSFPYYCA